MKRLTATADIATTTYVASVLEYGRIVHTTAPKHYDTLLAVCSAVYGSPTVLGFRKFGMDGIDIQIEHWGKNNQIVYTTHSPVSYTHLTLPTKA